MMAYSKNTKIISADGGFVFNAVCDSSTIVVPAEEGLKERLEAVLAETKLQEYKVTEEMDRSVFMQREFRHMPALRLLGSMQ